VKREKKIVKRKGGINVLRFAIAGNRFRDLASACESYGEIDMGGHSAWVDLERLSV